MHETFDSNTGLIFPQGKGGESSRAVGPRAGMNAVEMSSRALSAQNSYTASLGTGRYNSHLEKVYFHCSFLLRSGYPTVTVITWRNSWPALQ